MSAFAHGAAGLDLKERGAQVPQSGQASEGIINYFCRLFPPAYLCQVVGILSEVARKEIKGWLVAFPLKPGTMLDSGSPASALDTHPDEALG